MSISLLIQAILSAIIAISLLYNWWAYTASWGSGDQQSIEVRACVLAVISTGLTIWWAVRWYDSELLFICAIAGAFGLAVLSIYLLMDTTTYS